MGALELCVRLYQSVVKKKKSTTNKQIKHGQLESEPGKVGGRKFGVWQ